MLTALRRIEEFVDRKAKRTTWTVGWALFVAALGFIAQTMADLPTQNARIAEDRAIAIRYGQMVAKLEGVQKMLVLVVDANLQAVKYFQSAIENERALDSIDGTRVSRASELVAETKGGIDALVSVLDSLQIGESNADTIVQKFRADLAAMDQLLVRRERILDALRDRNLSQASEKMRELRVDPGGDLARQLNAFMLRVQAFDQVVEGQKSEHQANLELRRVGRRSYKWRVYLLGLAAAYAGAFLAIAYRTWRRDGARGGGPTRKTRRPNRRLQASAREDAEARRS